MNMMGRVYHIDRDSRGGLSIMRYVFLLLGLLLSSHMAYAESEARPEPMITTSQHGGYYFTMLPARSRDQEAFGVAYQLQDDGTSKELWRVHGWFAFTVYLSNQGKYLVRMGNWARGSAVSDDDLAVAFYKNGVELHSYSTADLVKNSRKVERTIGHYMWLAYKQKHPMLSYDGIFYLKTIDGIEYQFDVTTGLITSDEERMKKIKLMW